MTVMWLRVNQWGFRISADETTTTVIKSTGDGQRTIPTVTDGEQWQ